MTWLERALYLGILAVLGVSLVALKQRNGDLSDQASAAKAVASAPAAKGEG